MRQQVEEAEKTLYARRQRQNEPHQKATNGNGNDEAQRDAVKQVSELKLKLQEAQRENTAHQGNVEKMLGY